MNRRIAVICLLALVVVAHVPAADPVSVGPDPAAWNRVVDRGVAYLKSAQEDGGTWSKTKSPGITGLVTTALLRTGRVGADDPPVADALKYIESLANPKAGHIAGPDDAPLANYVTCINVMALQAAGREAKYKSIVGDAVAFLKRMQWDEAEGKTPESDFYGGAGYGGKKSRPDLSNTQFFLDALKAAGVPGDDPAAKKALVFVSRCQNFKSEHNDQPWAGKINDGSFIYTAAHGGENRRTDGEGTTTDLNGYGSMTYAGIKSMIYCGVPKDDPRMKKAFEWIRKNYTLDANPGMPPQHGNRGLYYYYHTMAKALDAAGVDVVEDARGAKHDWRKEITEALAKRQRADGSWINELDRWMEGDPNLVTSYALLALSYCKPKR